MPLDSDARDHLARLDGRAPISSLAPDEARAASRAARTLLPRPIEDVGSVAEERVPTSGGGVAVRLYSPVGRAGPLPALIYLHGGGWMLGDLDGSEAPCRQLTNRTRAMVISCEYSLAPEHPFPRAVLDAAETLSWVRDNAAGLGVDPRRIALGGESSGGNLAAGTCVMLRDEGVAQPLLQVLICPVTYCGLLQSDYDCEYDTPLLNSKSMAWFSAQYLGSSKNPDDPWASPVATPDLTGLAPAVIVSAGMDVLRSQIERFRERLEAAGVPVAALHYEGLFHGFFGLSGVLRGATAAMDEIAATVGAHLFS